MAGHLRAFVVDCMFAYNFAYLVVNLDQWIGRMEIEGLSDLLWEFFSSILKKWGQSSRGT